MQENTTYSILSPEGFASILWKDSSRAKEASEVMQITAEDLLHNRIIDAIIEEPEGGAHTAPIVAAAYLKDYLIKTLDTLTKMDEKTLLDKRYKRFRKFGAFME